MDEIPPSERCQAILKYVYHWRCHRRAVHGVLCAQHARFGATVPTRWEHERNERGVLLCEPALPFVLVSGRDE